VSKNTQNTFRLYMQSLINTTKTKWDSSWVSSKPKEVTEIRNKYISYTERHGELFEDHTVPLTTDDIDGIVKKKRTFKIVWLTAFLITMAICISVVLFSKELELEDYGYMVVALFFVGSTGYMMLSHFNKSVSNSKGKRVIKGVVTDKQMEERGCFLQLSLKLRLQIIPEDFRELNLGDIIRIESLSEDSNVRKKIANLGKI
jgi:hypothetical protein